MQLAAVEIKLDSDKVQGMAFAQASTFLPPNSEDFVNPQALARRGTKLGLD